MIKIPVMPAVYGVLEDDLRDYRANVAMDMENHSSVVRHLWYSSPESEDAFLVALGIISIDEAIKDGAPKDCTFHPLAHSFTYTEYGTILGETLILSRSEKDDVVMGVVIGYNGKLYLFVADFEDGDDTALVTPINPHTLMGLLNFKWEKE